MFVNRRNDCMDAGGNAGSGCRDAEVLYFESSGFCLWGKCLEQGQSRVHASSTGPQALSWTDLQLLLEGIEVQKARQFKPYRPAA